MWGQAVIEIPREYRDVFRVSCVEEGRDVRKDKLCCDVIDEMFEMPSHPVVWGNFEVRCLFTCRRSDDSFISPE